MIIPFPTIENKTKNVLGTNKNEVFSILHDNGELLLTYSGCDEKRYLFDVNLREDIITAYSESKDRLAMDKIIDYSKEHNESKTTTKEFLSDLPWQFAIGFLFGIIYYVLLYHLHQGF